MCFGPSLLHWTHLRCVLPVMDMMTCCLRQRSHEKETLQFCSHPYWSSHLCHSRDWKVVATLQWSETESSGWENKQKHTLLYLEELWPFELASFTQQKIISFTSRNFSSFTKAMPPWHGVHFFVCFPERKPPVWCRQNSKVTVKEMRTHLLWNKRRRIVGCSVRTANGLLPITEPPRRVSRCLLLNYPSFLSRQGPSQITAHCPPPIGLSSRGSTAQSGAHCGERAELEELWGGGTHTHAHTKPSMAHTQVNLNRHTCNKTISVSTSHTHMHIRGTGPLALVPAASVTQTAFCPVSRTQWQRCASNTLTHNSAEQSVTVEN